MAARTFYVAAGGNASDQNPGTEAAPWNTLSHARDALRPLIAAGLTEDVVVVIKGGVYPLTEPLVFGPPDSGTPEHSVTYAAAEGETVVVTGGRPIRGWRRAEGGLWTAHVLGVAEGEWYPELLVVNGRAATRARTPNADANPPYLQIAAQSIDIEKKQLRLGFPQGVIGDWGAPTDVQLVCQGNWEINRKRVVSLDPAGNSATFLLPSPKQEDLPWNWPGPGRWFFLENAREFLDQPGEWYLERATGTLTYWPIPGQDMAGAEVFARVANEVRQGEAWIGQVVPALLFRQVGQDDVHAFSFPVLTFTAADAASSIQPLGVFIKAARPLLPERHLLFRSLARPAHLD